MKIITWNVNGMRSVAKTSLAAFWERENPDVLCLQETKCHPDQLEPGLIDARGFHQHWSAARRPGYSGTVTFSRTAPAKVSHGIGIPKFDAEGRVVVTEFENFVLYNCYFPNGGSGPERHQFKQDFLRNFTRHLLKRVRAGDNVIVVGDYNVAYLDIDVYDPKGLANESGFLPAERAWMRQFLSDGFVDTFRQLHPAEPHRYSWWSNFQKARPGNRGWRIDYICVSRGLESRVRSADILDQQMGSDHCPVVLEIDL